MSISIVEYPASAQPATDPICDQLRKRVPNAGYLLKMAKPEKDDLKTFVDNNEPRLKACFGDQIEQLKNFLAR